MRGRILTNGLSGQQRVTQLFLEAQRQIVSRQVVLTVGQQDDAPKRVRDARKPLKTQGIVVLGHQDAHPKIAKALGLPIPVKGEWISVRLVSVSETDTRPFVELYGERWAIARDEEPVIPRNGGLPVSECTALTLTTGARGGDNVWTARIVRRSNA